MSNPFLCSIQNQRSLVAGRVRCAIAVAASVVVLQGCGGGGGGGGSSTSPPGGSNPPATTSDFEQGIFRSDSVYKDVCLNPRGAGFPDTQGTSTDENDWLRAWSNDIYLWYDEIVDEDPRDFETPEYFDLMRTFATTPSGADRDQFHFTFDTEEWEQLSQSGISAGNGMRIVLTSPSTPREGFVAYLEPGGPADAAGLARGDTIVEVDGLDFVNVTGDANVDSLNAALFPSGGGETHSFVFRSVTGQQKSVSMTSAEVVEDPVLITRTLPQPSGGLVGYMLFNDHISPAEARLVDEINGFAAQGITDLVLDLRYNGGGFLDIANELAFMVAGPAAASGRVFEEIVFNDKHPVTNPVTGASLSPSTFHQVSQGFSVPSGRSLPSLNLSRVFVLTTASTCSASESIINGLLGIDMEVVLVGTNTCGKPYGFYPTDNCGTTYFTIQFQGLNAKGFGDYADGFFPTATPTREDEVLGCVVADDFSQPLGDPSEAMLAAALEYVNTGSCPVGTNAANAKTVQLATQVQGSSAIQGGSLSGGLRIPGRVMRGSSN